MVAPLTTVISSQSSFCFPFFYRNYAIFSIIADFQIIICNFVAKIQNDSLKDKCSRLRWWQHWVGVICLWRFILTASRNIWKPKQYLRNWLKASASFPSTPIRVSPNGQAIASSSPLFSPYSTSWAYSSSTLEPKPCCNASADGKVWLTTYFSENSFVKREERECLHSLSRAEKESEISKLYFIGKVSISSRAR